MLLNKTRTVAQLNTGGPFSFIFDLNDTLYVSIQVISTGTPTATYAWKKANAPECDEKSLGAASTKWVTFSPSGAPANPAGAGANTVFEIPQFATRYLMLTVTDGGSGAGSTLEVDVISKGNG